MPGLTPGAAVEDPDPPCLADQLGRPADQRADRRAEPFREAEHHRVHLGRPVRDRHPGRGGARSRSCAPSEMDRDPGVDRDLRGPSGARRPGRSSRRTRRPCSPRRAGRRPPRRSSFVGLEQATGELRGHVARRGVGPGPVGDPGQHRARHHLDGGDVADALRPPRGGPPRPPGVAPRSGSPSFRSRRRGRPPSRSARRRGPGAGSRWDRRRTTRPRPRPTAIALRIARGRRRDRVGAEIHPEPRHGGSLAGGHGRTDADGGPRTLDQFRNIGLPST